MGAEGRQGLTMADRSIELQAAIYAALTAHTGLSAELGSTGRVYHNVPAGADTPYVVIGEDTAVDYSGTIVDALEHTITIHSFTESQSRLGCLQLQKQIRAALHEASLTLSAGVCVNIRQEMRQTMRDPDGISWHGVQRFRAVTN